MGTGVMVQSKGTAWFIIVFFLIGGIAFTVAMPSIWIGQIWIAVAVLLGIFFLFLSRKEADWERIKREGIRGQARILGGQQTGTYINEQPVMKLQLKVEAPGIAPFEMEKKATVPLLAIATLGSGRPLTVYLERDRPEDLVIDWNEAVAGAATATPAAAAGGTEVNVPANAEAGPAVMEALQQHGISPEGGTVDLRQPSAARDDVLRALKEHGVDVAHAQAAADPDTPVESSAQPLDRLQKLMELKNAQLISDEEFAQHKERILKDV